MKRYIYLFAIICFCCFYPDAKSQELKTAKNSVYFEIFGNGGLYSINYERALLSNIYARIGFGTWTMEFMEGPETKMTTVPFLITCIKGKKRSNFEIGGGFLFGSQKESNTSNTVLDLTGFLGYRYQPTEKGFLFRAGLTPFISLSSADYPDKTMVSFGFSFGYHF